MADYTPELFAKDGKHRYAQTPAQRTQLIYDGWVPTDQPNPSPVDLVARRDRGKTAQQLVDTPPTPTE